MMFRTDKEIGSSDEGIGIQTFRKSGELASTRYMESTRRVNNGLIDYSCMVYIPFSLFYLL